MTNELDQAPVWRRMDGFQVSSELFLNLVFTEACACRCPWCIARTRTRAAEDRPAWQAGLRYAMERFPVRSVIILGGEATEDPAFWEKLAFTAQVLANRPDVKLILTTNGIRLTEEAFLQQLLHSRIDAVNLSRMHWSQAENDRVFGAKTPTAAQIEQTHRKLCARGKTLRVNVNVWRGNLDTVQALERLIETLSGRCDAIKLTPLMSTRMFDTVASVTECSEALALPPARIRALFDALAARHRVLRRNTNVLGFVEYAELDVRGQTVLLKYAQVEDRYDPEREIPTLKLYPNGCLSNVWSHEKDIRAKMR